MLQRLGRAGGDRAEERRRRVEGELVPVDADVVARGLPAQHERAADEASAQRAGRGRRPGVRRPDCRRGRGAGGARRLRLRPLSARRLRDRRRDGGRGRGSRAGTGRVRGPDRERVARPVRQPADRDRAPGAARAQPTRRRGDGVARDGRPAVRDGSREGDARLPARGRRARPGRRARRKRNVFSSTETLFESKFATARSGLPSPSQIADRDGVWAGCPATGEPVASLNTPAP